MAKAFEVPGVRAPSVQPRRVPEVGIMDGAHPESDRIRRIERGFESSRLAPQRIAVAYEQVLPIIRYMNSAAETRKLEQGGVKTGDGGARQVMGA
jgi:hypothetical protein